MEAGSARVAHATVALVAGAAVLLQLGLVVDGSRVLVEHDPPGLGTRLARLVCYFTIQSNVLVAVVAALLARDPGRDGRTWRAVRLASVTGITVTGVVHWVLLRPLLDLTGWDRVADTLLHVVVPVVAVAAWLGWGPRPRVDVRAAAWSLAWPVAWLTVTLVILAITGWVPYPFLDPSVAGSAAVVVSCLAVTALFVAVAGVVGWLDRHLPPAPRG